MSEDFRRGFLFAMESVLEVPAVLKGDVVKILDGVLVGKKAIVVRVEMRAVYDLDLGRGIIYPSVDQDLIEKVKGVD